MPAGSYLKWRNPTTHGGAVCFSAYVSGIGTTPLKHPESGTILPPNEVTSSSNQVTLGTFYPTGRYGVDQSGDNLCVSKAPYLNCSQFCILRFHTSTGSNCGPVGSDKLGDEMVEEITRNQLRHQCFLSYIGKSYLGIIFQLLKEISQNIQWVKQKNTHIP